MEDTARLTLSQVCEVMKSCARAQVGVVEGHQQLFTSERLQAIKRLGSELWAQIVAAEAEAKKVDVSLSDPAFLMFKAKLHTRPRRRCKA